VSGAAYCWGLGYISGTPSSTPVLVPGGLTFSMVSVGYDSACGVTTSGAAYCWGSQGRNYPPRAVGGGLIFTSATVGFEAICGLTADGRAYCWGYNFFGELGIGSTAESSTPVPVSGNLSFASLSIHYYHTCGTTASGAAYCWGQNNEGEIGDGAAGAAVLTPTLVLGGLVFASINTNTESTCGLTTTDVAYCWGYNEGGQVGDGTVLHKVVPTLVPRPTGVDGAPSARSNPRRER